ncbi:hypothetical protein M431DRAFT_176797 [Trichoderma harzianum CBS 226.95]|uniref:Uncharacterized protein n=1 Tax=Trichoderma harzianum CBS 226.95 TaxID=983964 RepID=A0A2T4ATA7_TRIHA|nr:hypothetical protein M431DRAFT_176797 [Trichoderma harzianum CBS 226.95]PTB60290.1 hypothetical protein M431DRAFT_176797 [Trichoderma harzianum CBS 226.95]
MKMPLCRCLNYSFKLCILVIFYLENGSILVSGRAKQTSAQRHVENIPFLNQAGQTRSLLLRSPTVFTAMIRPLHYLYLICCDLVTVYSLQAIATYRNGAVDTEQVQLRLSCKHRNMSAPCHVCFIGQSGPSRNVKFVRWVRRQTFTETNSMDREFTDTKFYQAIFMTRYLHDTNSH